ncbi:MAG: FAD-dependent oxidoreductase [Clostridiales bacterium]|jgi:uncharacterized FAD-dependent dehydrogenase|nr:FAD-dependent oxidoreductase [Clostridiales bacterium]
MNDIIHLKEPDLSFDNTIPETFTLTALRGIRMIRVQQMKLAIDYKPEEIRTKLAKTIKIYEGQIIRYKIIKKSIDARIWNDIKYIFTIDATVNEEKKIVERCKNPNVTIVKPTKYEFEVTGSEKLSNRPIIVGAGPAGLFAAIMLSENGYKPLIIERGDKVDERVASVNEFWTKGKLQTNSNVQFGEGGAGTFSDGKLNTLVKDESGRNKKVLELFVEAGANEEILYLNKPHIGTDVLRTVVKNMREKIISLGGEFLFNTQVTDILTKGNKIIGVKTNTGKEISSEVVILAIGHSARDTFALLKESNVELQKKSFAIGLRIEHPQKLINMSQYGIEESKYLPASDYKLTHKCQNGRGVYSFCMCPGGFVVNSSSEDGGLVVNGMSNNDRAEVNGNSAIIVTVTPEDFESDDVLAGVEFQRKWERLAYSEGGENNNVPIQLLSDYFDNKVSNKIGDVTPSTSRYTFANLRKCLPEYINESIIEGVKAFDRKIKGFARPDAVLSGVETRTSSPIRIVRNDNFESNIKGLFPCGEGAGYAGGITSSAMDGIKVAEEIAKRYNSLD